MASRPPGPATPPRPVPPPAPRSNTKRSHYVTDGLAGRRPAVRIFRNDRFAIRPLAGHDAPHHLPELFDVAGPGGPGEQLHGLGGAGEPAVRAELAHEEPDQFG